jgi:alpha-ketoglutarate-dependent taurine dioxygenase
MEYRKQESAYSLSGSGMFPPIVWKPGGDASVASGDGRVWDRIGLPVDRIQAVLSKHGGILVRSVGLDWSAADVEQAILQVTPHLRDYIGGTSPRHPVHGKVMTATILPGEWSIPPHQEMAYTKTPPSFITFFCERPARIGGESTITDMRAVLAAIDSTIRQKFDRFGLQLRRVLPSIETMRLKPGIQKPWSEVFATDDRRKVEDIVNNKGWKAEWLPGDTLRLWQDIVPAVVTHPITGESIWCNQAHFFSPACMMAWAAEDGRRADYDAIKAAKKSHPEMLDDVLLGNGEPVLEDDALHIYRVLRQYEAELLLDHGDLLILDNLIFAHGRKPFTGDRRVLVVLSDRENSTEH